MPNDLLTQAQIHKTQVESDLLAAQLEEVQRRLKLRWYFPAMFWKPTVGGIVAAGLLTLWVTQLVIPMDNARIEVLKIRLEKEQLGQKANELTKEKNSLVMERDQLQEEKTTLTTIKRKLEKDRAKLNKTVRELRGVIKKL